MLGKRKAPSLIPPPKKKRKSTSAIEEIAFDFNAREDYLTGFHKRKLQRIKRAKEEAAKKEREEKITARKLIRDGRKADLVKHVEAVNSILRDGEGVVCGSDGEKEATKDNQWEGIAEIPEIDHEAEYIDEDRFTTVTVEAAEVFKDGLHRVREDDEEVSDHSDIHEGKGTAATSADGELAKNDKKKRVWTKERPGGPKKKKKKFKYESKADRKATRHKEKSKSKAKAQARRE